MIYYKVLYSGDIILITWCYDTGVLVIYYKVLYTGDIILSDISLDVMILVYW